MNVHVANNLMTTDGCLAGGLMCRTMSWTRLKRGNVKFGAGSALNEKTEMDPRTPRYVNSNLADYMIPVNADVGEVHIIMVPERTGWLTQLE